MALDDLHYLEINELARLIAARKVSPVELTEAMLRRIERVDPALKSYALVTPELALAQARAAEQMIGRRQLLSQLHGVPIAVKDLCWTEGIATAAGMPLHRDFVPSVDATVVRKLREAGAVLLGKLQLTEGAFADHHPDVAAPLNPWHRGPLVRRVVERLRRGDRGRPVLRLARLRHRRLDPLPVGGQRQHRPEADLGPGLALRLLRARRLARPHRADVPQRRRRGDHARRDRRRRPARSDRAAQRRCPTTSPADDGTLRGVRIGFDERYALDDVDADTRRAVETALATVRSLGAEIVTVRFPDVADDGRRLGPQLRRRDRGRARRDLSRAARPLRAGAGRPASTRVARCRAPTISASSCAGATSPAASSPRSMPVDAMLVPAQPIAAPTVSPHGDARPGAGASSRR